MKNGAIDYVDEIGSRTGGDGAVYCGSDRRVPERLEGLAQTAQVGASRSLGQTKCDRSARRRRTRDSAQPELSPAPAGGGGRSERSGQRGDARASGQAATGYEERVVASRIDRQKVIPLAGTNSLTPLVHNLLKASPLSSNPLTSTSSRSGDLN